MKPKRKVSPAGLEEEYRYFCDLLTKTDASIMAQASAVNYFRRLFTENTEPPRYFDESLIDTLNEIVADEARPLDVRTDAAWALTNLLCSKSTPLTHTIIEKGTLDVFVWCIRTSEHKCEIKDQRSTTELQTTICRLRDQCIWGVGNISADCPDCKEAVRDTEVLECIGSQILAGAFAPLESARCAVWCCLNILRGNQGLRTAKTARILTSAIAKTMRRHAADTNILQDSLLTLSLLADDRNYAGFPFSWPSQIDAMLNEVGLISTTLAAVSSTEAASVVSPALRLIGNIITGTDGQTERVIMREGFPGKIGNCLLSASGQVRREAAWILSNIATGPPNHVDLILTDKLLIERLLNALRSDDTRMQKEVCWVFTNALSSLNAGSRHAQLADFLGYGVLAIVEFASKPGADARLVSKIREVLSVVLVRHPEFWRVVEKAGAGSTPLLEVPKRKRRAADYVIYDEDAMEI